MDPDNEVVDQGEGQSTEPQFDIDAFNKPEPEQTSPISDGDNPKWEPFLKDIPTAFHDKFKTQLRTWDQQVQQSYQDKAKEWEPFKEFRDNKVDPAYLKSAYE